jgi:parvulin-like peptidyl-prolyl isomerase
VFELVERQDERTLSLEEATPTIRTALIAGKRVERAKETARQALDRLNAGASMEQVASEFKGEVQEAGPFARADFVPGLGRLNAAIGTAFGLRTGELSGVVESDRKLYLIRLLEREDAARADWEAQKAEQRQRELQALAEQRWSEFLAALREQAEVVDGREELDRRIAQGALN